MLRHIVFWKIKDNEDKEKNMERMVKMLYSLDGKIKGLESIELGYSFDQPSEYDVVLYAIFKSPSALKFYQNHPEHVKCKEFISGIAVKRACVDYVPEDPEFLTLEPEESPAKTAEIKPDAASIPKTPAEPVAVKASESKEKEVKPTSENDDTSVPDIQTSSAASYQSLVRPVIPGINAPIDFVPTKEDEEDYNSLIPEVVQKSIRQTQEDYDILESVIDDDQYGIDGFEDNSVADESSDTADAQTDTAITDEKPVVAEAVESIKPVEPKSAKPINSAESVKTTDKPNTPAASTQSVEKVSTSMPFSKQNADSISTASKTPSFSFTPSANEEAVKREQPVIHAQKPLIDIPNSEAAVKAPKQFPPAAEPTKPIEAVKPSVPPIPPIPSAKPQKKSRFFGTKKVQEETPKEDDMTNKWRCPSCGRVNANYVGTCGCGESKPFDDFGQPVGEIIKPKQEEAAENGWKCPKCGLLHSNFITDCSCGYVNNAEFTVKPMSDESSRSDFKNENDLPPVAPMRASDFSANTPEKISTNMPKPAPIEVSAVDTDKIKGLKFHGRSSNAVAPAAPTQPAATQAPSRPIPPPPQPLITKPEKKSFFGRKKKTEEVKEEIDMTKFWKCPSCGKLNHNYVGTCGCGESKPFNFDFGDDNEGEEFVPKSNAWKCPECGKLNNNFVTRCACGYESNAENAE